MLKKLSLPDRVGIIGAWCLVLALTGGWMVGKFALGGVLILWAAAFGFTFLIFRAANAADDDATNDDVDDILAAMKGEAVNAGRDTVTLAKSQWDAVLAKIQTPAATTPAPTPPAVTTTTTVTSGG